MITTVTNTCTLYVHVLVLLLFFLLLFRLRPYILLVCLPDVPLYYVLGSLFWLFFCFIIISFCFVAYWILQHAVGVVVDFFFFFHLSVKFSMFNIHTVSSASIHIFNFKKTGDDQVPSFQQIPIFPFLFCTLNQYLLSCWFLFLFFSLCLYIQICITLWIVSLFCA